MSSDTYSQDEITAALAASHLSEDELEVKIKFGTIKLPNGETVTFTPYICMPDSRTGAWDGLKPDDFVDKHGALKRIDLPELMILLKDEKGNFYPAPEVHAKFAGPDHKLSWGQRKDLGREVRKACGIPEVECMKAERLENGTYQRTVKDPKTGLEHKETQANYDLHGEQQLVGTDGGVRVRQHASKYPTTSGDAGPDYCVEFKSKLVLAWHLPDDGLETLAKARAYFKTNNIALKSTGNLYHAAGYIDARSDKWNTAEHRWDGYLRPGRSDGHEIYLRQKDGAIRPAKLFLTHGKDTPEGRALVEGPKAGQSFQILTQDIHGNTLIPIQQAQVLQPNTLLEQITRLNSSVEKHAQDIAIQTKEAHTKLSTDNDNKDMAVEDTKGPAPAPGQMYSGAWARTEKSRTHSTATTLTKDETTKMFNDSSNSAPLLVNEGSSWLPAKHRSVTARGPKFEEAYPADKRKVLTVGPNGYSNGSYRTESTLTGDLPPEAKADLDMMRTDPGAVRSRYAEAPANAAQPTGQMPATPRAPTKYEDRPVPPVMAPDFTGPRADLLNRQKQSGGTSIA